MCKMRDVGEDNNDNLNSNLWYIHWLDLLPKGVIVNGVTVQSVIDIQDIIRR